MSISEESYLTRWQVVSNKLDRVTGILAKPRAAKRKALERFEGKSEGEVAIHGSSELPQQDSPPLSLVILKKRMSSLEEAISSGDPDVIKKRRSTIQGGMTKIQNRLGKLLQRSAGKFDHDRIKRLNVQGDHADLKKLFESFKMIDEAYQHYRAAGKDEPEEVALVKKQEEHYDEVVDKVYESLQLVADYEESYHLLKASQPDPDLAKKEAEEKASKAALAKQLKDEELLQKQEADAAAKAEEDRIKKELRANIVKKEKQYIEAVGRYRTAKKYSEDMTRFARGLSKEQVVSQVMEFAHVRSLPTYETKNLLLDRFEIARNAAEAFEDAIFAESGTDVKDKVEFDGVAEDASVQDIVNILNLLLNAKVEYNGKGI